MTGSYEWLGFLLIGLAALLLAVGSASRARSRWPLALLIVGVGLRIVGTYARWWVIFGFYDGVADAVRYYDSGLELAESVSSLQDSPLGAAYWAAPIASWWGTEFLIRLSGAVLSLIGPTLPGEFLFFSLVSFVGLVLIATVFAQHQPRRRIVYAAVIFAWPSLWFWPSSVGKEAILFLALGLATYGYCGTRDKVRWVPFALGIGLAFCVRPHFAAVVGMSALAAEWLGSWTTVTPRRLTQLVGAGVLGVAMLVATVGLFGQERPELDGMFEFYRWQQFQSSQGGSAIRAAPLSVTGVPLAFVNVWMRPFVWETGNPMSVAAAVEVLAFWGLVAWRRREVVACLRHWRAHRMLRFALPFIVMYTLMIGLTFGNLGIIARQRAPVFPFMLLIVLAVPRQAEQRAMEVGARQPSSGPA